MALFECAFIARHDHTRQQAQAADGTPSAVLTKRGDDRAECRARPRDKVDGRQRGEKETIISGSTDLSPAAPPSRISRRRMSCRASRPQAPKVDDKDVRLLSRPSASAA